VRLPTNLALSEDTPTGGFTFEGVLMTENELGLEAE
jgi:hypothetical protein